MLTDIEIAESCNLKDIREIAKKLGLISDTGAARGAVSSTLTAGESFLLYFFPKILLLNFSLCL